MLAFDGGVHGAFRGAEQPDVRWARAVTVGTSSPLPFGVDDGQPGDPNVAVTRCARVDRGGKPASPLFLAGEPFDVWKQQECQATRQARYPITGQSGRSAAGRIDFHLTEL